MPRRKFAPDPEDYKKVVALFAAGGNNSITAIVKQTGLKFDHVSRIINMHLESKRTKIINQ